MNFKAPKSLPPAEQKQWRATMKAQAKIDKALGFGKTPKPPKFPMKFREFLRRAFGGRYHGDRLHLYRKFLADELMGEEIMGIMLAPLGEYNGPSPEDRASEYIANISRRGVRDSDEFFKAIRDIQVWRKSNQIQQRREANASRWLKENRKKLLAVLNHRINALSQTEKCSLASPKLKKSVGSHFKK